MEGSSAMCIFMTLFICFCFNIVNVNAGFPGSIVSHAQFYLQHKIVRKEDATAVQVATQKPMKISGGVSYSGPVYVIDHPLTETPDPKSRELGRAQGMYSMSSQGEFSLLMAMTYSIHSGKYKGGELNVAGKHMPLPEQRELPVVGGSGLFRMAKGYAFAHTHSIQGPNAVIGYNVTVYHSAT